MREFLAEIPLIIAENMLWILLACVVLICYKKRDKSVDIKKDEKK